MTHPRGLLNVRKSDGVRETAASAWVVKGSEFSSGASSRVVLPILTVVHKNHSGCVLQCNTNKTDPNFRSSGIFGLNFAMIILTR